MEFVFTDRLAEEYTGQIIELFSQLEFSSIEQYPGFAESSYPNEKIIHGIMLSMGDVIGYAQLRIKKRIIGSIYFGPLVKTENDFSCFIREIKKYCQRKLIPILKIYPPYFVNKYSIFFMNKLKTEICFEITDSVFNWSTLILKINRTDEEIFNIFSNNHKRSIKKATKEGFQTEFLKINDLDTFNNQFCSMYESRGIKINHKDNFFIFKEMFNFFEKTNTGFFIGVKHESKLVGGLCIAFGNNVAFYF
jgi:hypothetical protein